MTTQQQNSANDNQVFISLLAERFEILSQDRTKERNILALANAGKIASYFNDKIQQEWITDKIIDESWFGDWNMHEWSTYHNLTLIA